MITSKELIDVHSLKPTPTNNKPSIALISIHKTASSYFSTTVLKQVNGMEQIDYQTCHYSHGDKFTPIINPEGYIYGVLRIYDDDHPSRVFTESVIKNIQLNELDIAILIRDPRDVIVSMYYSFGFSHELSSEKSTRQYQLRRRQNIQSMNIDEYAIYVLPQLKEKLRILIRLSHANGHSTILKYDEMITNFKSFFTKLQRAIPVNVAFESKMYADTRPQPVEKFASHRRSGAVGGYKEKLKKETISRINHELKDALDHFDYN